MNTPLESDARFHRLGVKLGLFVGVGAILALSLVLALAVRQGLFSAKTPVYFQAASGSDLRSGMAVKLSGFKIGQVYRVELNQLAKVDVEMRIEDRYMRWIKADSVATLAREGMIGDSFISITSGSVTLPALTSEDRLKFVLGSSIGDIALDMRNRAVPVIEELHGFLRYMNNPRGDVRGSFAELNKLTRELRETRQQLAVTLAKIDHLAAADMPDTLRQTRHTLQQAEASLQTLEKTIPALAAQADKSLQALSTAGAKAGEAADQASQLLAGTTPRLNTTLNEAHGLLQESRAAVSAARKRWPFKGGEVEPAKEAIQNPVPPERANPASPEK